MRSNHLVIVLAFCFGTGSLKGADQEKSPMSGSLDLLQQHGFVVLPRQREEAETRDFRPHLRDLAVKIESVVTGILAPAWCLAGDGEHLAPLGGEEGRPDLFLSHYRVKDHQVELVIGELRATITVMPQGSNSTLPTLRNAKEAYVHWMNDVFAIKPRTDTQHLLAQKVGEFWLIKQRTRSGSANPSIRIPWDWPESIEAAFDEQGGWMMFSVDYHLPKEAESMPAGGRLRTAGSWFDSGANASTGKKSKR